MSYPRFLPLLMVASAIQGCDGPPLSPNDPSLLTVEVSIARDSLRARDTAQITLIVNNPTPYPFDRELGFPGLWFVVLDENGEAVGPGCCGAFPIDIARPRRLTLAPGESMERGFTWPRHSPGSGLPRPGLYTIVGQVTLIGDTATSDPRPLQLLPIVSLEALASAGPVRVGETVELTVALTNLDHRQARLPAFTSCSFEAVVWRGDRPVELLSGCPPGNPLQVLAAGETSVATFDWRPSEPGDYRVVFRLPWPEQPGLETTVPIRVG